MEAAKKKHVGLKVYLVILFILILIPVLIYCYLRFSTFESEKPVIFEEAGTAELMDDGSMVVRMTACDLQEFYADYYKADVDEELSSFGFISVNGLSFFVRDGAPVIYADVELLGVIPLHLKAEADFSVANDVATAELHQVKIGKWITLSKEKLQKLGIGGERTIELEQKIGAEITSLTLEGDGARLEVGDFGLRNAAVFLRDEVASRSRVFQYLSQDLDSVPDCILSAYNLSTARAVSDGSFADSLLKDEVPADTYLRLLACVSDETAKASFDMIIPMARKCFFADHDEKLKSLREEEDSRIIDCIEPYRLLMDRVETDWCELAMFVDDKSISYADSGEKLPETPGLEPERFESAYAGIYMVDSNNSTWMVRTAGYPSTKELNLAKDFYVNRIPTAKTGISVYLRIPEGTDMLMYYQANGNLVLSALPEDIIDELSTEYGIPFFFEDHILKPHTRLPAFVAPDGTVLEILIPDGADQ